MHTRQGASDTAEPGPAPETFTLTAWGDFSEFLGDLRVVARSIGPDGAACVLAVNARDADAVHQRGLSRGGGSFAPTRTRRPYPAVAFHYDGLSVRRTELPEVPFAFPSIQIFPTGEVLLAGARCHYTGRGPELNAALYSPEGTLLHPMTLGDGIQDVQVSSRGEIWVSYFDEGIFGNLGWNPPLGEPGLVCFGPDGHIRWKLEAPEELGPIADCYALNVAEDATWACYYLDFPVVRIAPDHTLRGWKNRVRGASALAVSSSHVLHWGGYQDEPSRCTVQRLGAGSLTHPRDLHLRLPEGPLLSQAKVIGRGSLLHAFVGTRWYQFNVNHLPWW